MFPKTGCLHSYLYSEAQGKKGANNAGSQLMHHIKNYVLKDNDSIERHLPLPESNLIMNNYGGQNKNGTVIKMDAFMCEIGWFNKVNLIFLIKGHTKDSCDQMFNLLKMRWHKANVYIFD